MAIVVACNVHLECASGKINIEWKIKPVDFHRFSEKPLHQMLTHSPKECKCAGDERFQESTQSPRRQQARHRSPPRGGSSVSSSSSSASRGVTTETLMWDPDQSGNTCGYLSKLRKHAAAIKPIPNKNKRARVVCGKDCCQMCTICDSPMHCSNPPKEVPDIRSPCFFLYHDQGCVGLA